MNEIPEVTQTEQDQLLKLLRKHRKALLKYPNVHSVDVGLEFSDGKPTGRLAIRVHVGDKQPEAALADGDVLPEELDGIPVDVLQTRPGLQLVNRDNHIDPLVGGLTIASSNVPGFIGTLGMVVFDSASLKPMALSNHHVMVGSMPGSTSVQIGQPGLGVAADTVGTLARWNKQYDCAVCWVASRTWESGAADATARIRGLNNPVIGATVTKSGRTTLVTNGVIDGVDNEGFTVIPDPSVPAAGGEISAGGDSGSIWTDRGAQPRAIGLHYAGETDPDPAKERAWAKRMTSVASLLKVVVLDEVMATECWIGGSGHVVARTRPGAPCSLSVQYPKGRISSAKGLGSATADANGWVEWRWTVGTSTRHNAAVPVSLRVTLDGVQTLHFTPLKGTTRTDH